MKHYVAKFHIGLHKSVRPGEVIEEQMDEETIRRLEAMGAIEEIPGWEEPEDIEPPALPDREAENGEHIPNALPEKQQAQEEVGATIDVMAGVSKGAGRRKAGKG